MTQTTSASPAKVARQVGNPALPAQLDLTVRTKPSFRMS
jgi:hypothetical protein